MDNEIKQAVECVLSLFLIGLVGYVLDKRGWFTPELKALWPRLVLTVVLPAYLYKNIVTTFNHQNLKHLFQGVAVPTISILLCFAIGCGLAKVTRMPRARAGIFATTFATSNTIFIGLPVNIALFGEEALPYVLLYFFANTTFFWTVGNYQFSRCSNGPTTSLWSRTTLKNIFSPPLIGFFLGLLSVMSDLTPPAFILNAAGHIGNMTTPMAVIFIGLTLSSVSWKDLVPDQDIWLLLAGRFIISPLIIIIMMLIIKLPPLMAKVFVIQSSLPTIITAVLLSEYYQADTKFTSVAVALNTLLALVTVPFYMVLCSLIF
ncbi:MAG: hypothetical protein AMR96_02990 [Candidatus Adiutrix intracellularis]|nr:MAG: hypothetical protein AMR96_02990 [Candidatus Adiutrix intracellularis]